MAGWLNRIFGSGNESTTVEASGDLAPLHVTDSDFEEVVLQSTLPVVVDFWAPWCMPCRMIAPTLEKLAVDYAGRAVVAKVNTDENSNWAIKYGVQGIPTLLFVQNGQVVDRIVGVVPAGQIRQKLDSLVEQ